MSTNRRDADDLNLKIADESYNHQKKEVDDLRRENKRLREMCEDIVEAWRWKNDNPYPGITDETFGDRITKLRKALTQPQEANDE